MPVGRPVAGRDGPGGDRERVRRGWGGGRRGSDQRCRAHILRVGLLRDLHPRCVRPDQDRRQRGGSGEPERPVLVTGGLRHRQPCLAVPPLQHDRPGDLLLQLAAQRELLTRCGLRRREIRGGDRKPARHHLRESPRADPDPGGHHPELHGRGAGYGRHAEVSGREAATGRDCRPRAAGIALESAFRTSRRCTPSFRATARIVPAPCSYSRRICSYSSTLALLFSKTVLPSGPRGQKQGTRFMVYRWGQIRASKGANSE